MIPNAVVIAFDQRVQFEPLARAPEVRYARHGTLAVPVDPSLPEEERPGWVVDGQQRIAAIRDARLESFPIFAVAFLTDEDHEQREQFILVNSTKPLPKGLIYEPLPNTSTKPPSLLQQRRFPAYLLIHEIYRSIQGESTFAGLPCVFVRLTACSARCSWCDTPHAFREGTLRTVADVFDWVLSFDCPLVELTGGEPLLQAEAFELMTALANAGKTVLLETSGVVSIRGVDPRVHVIMDLKCPDSGECENNVWENLALLKAADQIKFVIASRRDFDWTVGVIREHSLEQRFIVLLSAVFGQVSPRDLAEWLLESRLAVRMQLQMHKFIWEPDARGV